MVLCTHCTLPGVYPNNDDTRSKDAVPCFPKVSGTPV